MKKVISTAPIFYAFSAILFVLGLILNLIFDKKELHLILNSIHFAELDSFFVKIDFLGEGVFSVIVIFVLLFTNFRRALIAAVAVISASTFTQLLKRFVFTDSLRPSAFFENPEILPLIDGVAMHSQMSFPSGHATSVFAIFCVLTLIYNKTHEQILFFILAAFAAFARVYLSQHFLFDITMGMVIGISFASLSAILLSNVQHPVLNKSLMTKQWFK